MSFQSRESQANQRSFNAKINNQDTQKRRNNRSGGKTKRLAESSFDAFAAPKSLIDFVSDLNPERPFKFTFINEHDKEEVTKELPKKEPIEVTEFKVLSSISIAKRISPTADVEDYHLDQLFVEPVESFLDQLLDNKKVSTDFNLEPEAIKQQRSEKLFQAATGLESLMPEMTKQVLKPKDELKNHTSRMFHDTPSGIKYLRDQLMNHVKTDHQFISFSKEYEKRDVFNNDSFLVEFANNHHSTHMLACLYVLEKIPSLLTKRNIKIKFLGANGSNGFLNHNLTVRQLFLAINVEFFNDLFDNPSWDSQVTKLAMYYFNPEDYDQQYPIEEVQDHDQNPFELKDTACSESDPNRLDHQLVKLQVRLIRSRDLYQQVEKVINFI